MIGAERTDFIGVPVTDRERAVKFYGETLGLKRNPLAHEEWPEFETGNVTILLNTPEQTGVPFSPSNTAIALRVPDVAEAMAKLEEAGVTFLFPEAYDSGVCHMAFFKDPDGNSLILHHRHAAVRRRHDPVAMQVEHVDFVSVLTQDLQRAKQFYVETLGLEVETEGDNDMELRCGQVTLDVFDPSSIGQPFAPSPAGLALRVPDVDAARAELEAKGVVFDGDTITTGVCKQAWFKDPDGNALMLHRRFDV